MNIFQMKTKPHNTERFREFIDQKFVCIGWPGIGNLEQADKDQIRQKLAETYNCTGHKLGNLLGQVNTFVNTMKKGDVVLIVENDSVYAGKVGDYEYKQQYDNNQDGMCHTRSVEWFDRILITNLDSSIQRFVSNRNTICEYPESADQASLEKLLGKQPLISKEDCNKLDVLFQEALLILEAELKSNDPDRRIKAAMELIRLKNNK